MILSSINKINNCILRKSDGEHYARFSGLMLRSVFQPIFTADENIIGLEALLRIQSEDGRTIRPDDFFHTDLYSNELKTSIEALSRAIHILNFAQSEYSDKKLFLNILPDPKFNQLDVHKSSEIREHLEALDLQSNQIVMEFVELEVKDKVLLSRVKTVIEKSGCAIAVDDYGSNASNKERVTLLNPEIVKIDRGILTAFMNGLVAPLNSALKVAAEVGAKTVIEGIETREQFEQMVQLKIDMFQGYHLAQPEPISIRANPTINGMVG
ncbi:EAL domain-containing protein [Vibrio tapetis]|uniref:Putative Diguanylate phosphodiesterase n=1 Tax=Vibrio tapetis subsp. tapetis TaxID=1671868 RepID=A0A2N8ZNA2_9VIBR|nr:EAL domain-containing protein [Vibrio tapetis]SON53372.1 putative Diguanylate phosphodiesterase [Vibrio tapetis subsp. tapetis]